MRVTIAKPDTKRPAKFPPWRLPKSAGVVSSLPCPRGVDSRLRIERDGQLVREVAVRRLLAQPGAVTLDRPRRRVLPAALLTAPGGDVEFVPCRGKTLTLSRDQLAQRGRYVLVPNRKGQLKLVDRGRSLDQFRRLSKRVVVMRLSARRH